MVRVIAGSAKNKKLLVPATGTRAVTDRIKTVIFDLLREFIQEAKVLDLYAGSGAYGIEALSRGAKTATFIDASEQATALIAQNLRNCNFSHQGKIIQAKLPAALDQVAGQTFDLIFCDPPFSNLAQFNLADYQQLITTQNLFCLRLPSQLPKSISLGNFTLVYQKQLGLSTIYFLRA